MLVLCRGERHNGPFGPRPGGRRVAGHPAAGHRNEVITMAQEPDTARLQELAKLTLEKFLPDLMDALIQAAGGATQDTWNGGANTYAAANANGLNTHLRGNNYADANANGLNTN